MARSTAVVLKAAAVAGLLPSLMIAATVFLPGHDLVSSRGYYLGQDFVNFWTGGHLALTGHVADVYDVDPYRLDRYNAAVRALFPPASAFLNFSYPPHILPLLAVMAMLPYTVALVLWQVAGVVAFLMVAFAGAGRTKVLDLLPYVLISPIVVLVATVGQASFFLAALLVGGLLLLPRRPVLAGVLFGLLTIKPQLGLLLVPTLLLLRQYRAIGAAALTALALAGLSVAWFGLAPWHEYVTRMLPFQQLLITEMTGIYPSMMVTPYAALWWLGVPVQAALAVHWVIAAAIALVTLMVVWRSRAEWSLKIAVLTLGSLLVTPYCLSYDLAVPAAALLLWLLRREEPLEPATLCVLFLFWLLPYPGMLIALWGLPAIPIVAMLLLMALVREVQQRSAPVATSVAIGAA